jgi:hypothetical protein
MGGSTGTLCCAFHRPSIGLLVDLGAPHRHAFPGAGIKQWRVIVVAFVDPGNWRNASLAPTSLLLHLALDPLHGAGADAELFGDLLHAAVTLPQRPCGLRS